MNVPRLRTALLLLALPGALGAQTTDRSAAPSRLGGTWQVSYEDLALGEVDGVATVEADGRHVSVVLHAAGQSGTYTLTAESVIEQGDDYTIVLNGESPFAPGLLPDEKVRLQAVTAARDATVAAMAPVTTITAAAGRPVPKFMPAALPATAPHGILPPVVAFGSGQGPTPPPDVHISVPGDATKIEVAGMDFHGEVELKPRHPVEVKRVELRLHFGKSGGAAAYTGPPGDLLTGTWMYYANPVTWRDAVGQGRVGYFRRDPADPNLTTQSAAEVWLRPSPPGHMTFFAVGVFNLKRIDALYIGVPTVVETIFDEPQERETCTIEVQIEDRGKLALTAHRDPGNWRRFVSEPFLPGSR
jgi:hypothetical protein